MTQFVANIIVRFTGIFWALFFPIAAVLAFYNFGFFKGVGYIIYYAISPIILCMITWAVSELIINIPFKIIEHFINGMLDRIKIPLAKIAKGMFYMGLTVIIVPTATQIFNESYSDWLGVESFFIDFITVMNGWLGLSADSWLVKYLNLYQLAWIMAGPSAVDEYNEERERNRISRL